MQNHPFFHCKLRNGRGDHALSTVDHTLPTCFHSRGHSFPEIRKTQIHSFPEIHSFPAAGDLRPATGDRGRRAAAVGGGVQQGGAAVQQGVAPAVQRQQGGAVDLAGRCGPRRGPCLSPEFYHQCPLTLPYLNLRTIITFS